MAKNIDILGTSLSYDIPMKELIENVKDRLTKDYLVTISGFPPSNELLLEFLANFGTPLMKNSSKGQAVLDYIGDVGFKPDIQEEKRLPTQGCGEILFHTARAFATIRPTFFSMLMVNPGWIDKSGESGESRLVCWRDVIKDFYVRFPSTAEHDLHLLSTIPISYKPWYAKDEQANAPLILIYKEEDKMEVRVWEDIISSLKDVDIPDKDIYMDALERFCSTANSCTKAIEYIMEENMMVILDNRKVAHARKPFVGQIQDANGNIRYNPRRILSTHIL